MSRLIYFIFDPICVTLRIYNFDKNLYIRMATCMIVVQEIAYQFILELQQNQSISIAIIRSVKNQKL